LPRVVAIRAFYLDDFTAKIGQRLTGPWASQNTRHFNYFETR
jgi:hypothetical protein